MGKIPFQDAPEIKKYSYWTLVLHDNQSYLGRAICYLNVTKRNIVDLSQEEYLELFSIIKEYQRALGALWSPDAWNYAQLGNVVHHLHLHFIPRYKTSRVYKGQMFSDEQWGKHYAPAPEYAENTGLNMSIALAIREKIR